MGIFAALSMRSSIQNHILYIYFVLYGYFLFHLLSVTVSKFKCEYSEWVSACLCISYFKLNHTTACVCLLVCINVLLHHRMDFDGMFGCWKQTLGTLYSTHTHTLYLSLSLCTVLFVCMNVWNMHWALTESVSFVRSVSISFSLSFDPSHPSPCTVLVYNTHGVYSYIYNTYIQFSK